MSNNILYVLNSVYILIAAGLGGMVRGAVGAFGAHEL